MRKLHVPLGGMKVVW